MKKINLKLSRKLVIGFVLLGILTCATSFTISYFKYKTAVEKRYNDMSYEIAAVGISYVNGDDIERYLATGQTDEAYSTMSKYISELRKNMNANYIYIARLQGINLTYVYDADNPDDDYPPFVLGDTGTINPDFEKEAYEIVTKGVRVNNYFYSKSQFGYNTSAIVPIYNSNNEIVGILGVEIAMEMLQSMLLEFLLFASTASAALIAVFISLYLRYLQRNVVSPIRLMTDEADSFIKNETTISQRLKTVVTGDEIEQLASAIYKMETDINEYIENLTAITAEKERIGAELSVATQIQSSMLPCIFPPFPDFSEFDIYATMVPAKEIGGDFYDFFMLDGKNLVFIIADVSGKSIPAALFMVITKTLIKNHTLAGNCAGDIFTAVNSQLCENNEANMFVTAWMGIYDIASGKLTYVNAGHNPPLLQHKNGRYEYLKTHAGFVLGGMDGIVYRSSEIYLGEGDSLFLYTDGITEATNSAMALYGEARLQDILNSIGDMPPSEILSIITDDINQFAEGTPQFDDITMLAIRILKCENPSLTVASSIDSAVKITEFVDFRLKQSGCPENIKPQINIAIDEIFSNISNYSKSESVTVTFYADKRGVEITFSDNGVPYNPLESDAPDISLSAEERNVGGLGIFIVKNLMDKVSYNFIDDKNILTIYKNYEQELN